MNKSELLSIDEIAALLGKSVAGAEAEDIIQNANIQIADKYENHNLYDHRIIVEFIKNNPKTLNNF